MGRDGTGRDGSGRVGTGRDGTGRDGTEQFNHLGKSAPGDQFLNLGIDFLRGLREEGKRGTGWGAQWKRRWGMTMTTTTTTMIYNDNVEAVTALTMTTSSSSLALLGSATVAL